MGFDMNNSLLWIAIMFVLFYIYIDGELEQMRRFKKEMMVNYANLEMALTGRALSPLHTSFDTPTNPYDNYTLHSLTSDDLIPTKEENALGLMKIDSYKKQNQAIPQADVPYTLPNYNATGLLAYDADGAHCDYAPFVIQTVA